MKDRWLRLIGIPALGLLIPLLFNGAIRLHDPEYLATLTISFLCTLLLWEGNRFIQLLLRKKYSRDRRLQQRMALQLIFSVLYTIVVVLAICVLLVPTLLGVVLSTYDLFSNIFAAIAITMMMTAFYESIYFARRWRMSIMRAEVIKRDNLRNEYENLKNQVNPYFLFNSLNTLSGLIGENKALAVDFVHHLANAYRYVLQTKDARLVEMEKELRFVETYIFLLRQRHGEHLDVTVETDNDARHRLIPPLTLQILVENAVKHNIISQEQPLHVQVHAIGERLIVINNLQKRSELENYSKIGLKNIRDRYQYLVDRPVEIVEDMFHFTVHVPLISTEEA